ncbi:MAG: PQQ-binding-like beta-propeller repeat protein, partial [Planctomycetaceae bacterium]|nr:PQQ-binding-like beta-propeller repeat protein [Planctomycetaceae bacterium]
MRTLLAWAMLCGVTAASSPAQAGDGWAQFRGPNSSGVSTAEQSLPVEFSATENVHWKVDLGDGVGCPVVKNGRVYVSAMDGEQAVALLCFDVASGKQLWKRSFHLDELPNIHRVNSYASTTPAVDDERVYFYSATLGMMAFDAKTGADVWRTPLPKPFFVFVWGAAMSPVLHDGRLLFVQDDDLNPALYSFDTATGKILWKDDRSDMAVNYSHPVIVQTDRGDEIVVAGTGKLIGYDPETGKRLWYARVLLRNIKTTPSASGDRVYISLQSGGIANQWLATADKNSDGKLTRDEIRASTEGNPVPESFFAKFDRGDVNKDGFLEGEELDKAFLHPDNFAGARYDADDPAESWVMAVRGGGSGDVTDTHVLWREES